MICKLYYEPVYPIKNVVTGQDGSDAVASCEGR